MKTSFALLALFSLFSTVAEAALPGPGNPDGYLKGYLKTVHGEKFSYHSAQPDVSAALLVRSIEKKLYIEWETEPVPKPAKGKKSDFIFMAAIDVNSDNPHKWDIFLNGSKCFTISSPLNDTQKSYSWKNENGCTLTFNAVLTDQHGDQHGYMILSVPEGFSAAGEPIRIKAEGENANSPTWFMIFRYAMEPSLKLIEEQAVIREGDSEYQQVRVEYVYLGKPVAAEVISSGKSTPVKLSFGYNTIRAKLPVVKEPSAFPVMVTTGKNKILAKETFTLNPVVQRTIHLLHHSHVDIGYTHVQDEVKHIQWKNLEDAIAYAEASSSAAPGAKFRWNSEVMWPIESYLRENQGEKADRLRNAISKGWIGLDGLYTNTLTELCNSEELVQLTRDARRIAAECGVKVESAMITDIPGWSWGLVPVLSQSGIKYLSLGTNVGHRIGGTIKEWGDRPFYWVSPSGEEKVLCWIHEKAYSMFHTGLKYTNLRYRLDESKIFGYLNDLYARNYPYEIVTLRYNIGSDNGPADPTLSQAVEAWNKKYVSPKILIKTVSESFSEFEKRYGDMIPSVRGAFTGYWEDGAASSAAETSLNRKAASETVSSGALAVIKGNREFTKEGMYETWRNILLYDEHTWGSWNSISEPENPFTLSQWATKREFAITAARLSSQLLKNAVNGDAKQQKATEKVKVFNPHSWDITSLIRIPADLNRSGNAVINGEGKEIPSQVLTTGELVFVAEKVPAMGSSVYTFGTAVSSEENGKSDGLSVENDFIKLSVDPSAGGIKSLVIKRNGTELCDTSNIPGLNTYYYIAGRSPSERYKSRMKSVTVTENGKVLKQIKSVAEGKGAKLITNTYTVVNGIDRVYITTAIDKVNIYTPESVHLGYSFRIPGGVTRLDLAYGFYRTEADQVKAACKNYLTPEKWVDISNQETGVTFISPDAPLIESGDITTDATAYGWIDELRPSQTIYSYVMNNYWETNYKASQEGETRFRYVLVPHGIFLPSSAERAALEESEPLVIVPAGTGEKGDESLFRMKDNSFVVTSVVPENDGYTVRLLNISAAPAIPEISWKEKPAEVFECDFDGNKTGSYPFTGTVPALGLRNIRVRR